ncbi:hypothetical protein CEXT_138431 [Caerostris extrusa]|uniref:Uncharacterized protein n=1 Tax=Caerostris extrusa TaxID=172846 RepID=A0AAV4VPU6_CAEEX|nr:hypothetical protein CEXT_138431 [Caerostris extrusa]
MQKPSTHCTIQKPSPHSTLQKSSIHCKIQKSSTHCEMQKTSTSLHNAEINIFHNAETINTLFNTEKQCIAQYRKSNTLLSTETENTISTLFSSHRIAHPLHNLHDAETINS